MTLLKTGLAAACLAMVPSGFALAVDPECENTGLRQHGQCVTTHVVEWCTPDGEYRLLACAEGDICAPTTATDDEGNSRGLTCIDRAVTECADIPDEGKCAESLEVVLYCVNGVPKSHPCEGDTECGFAGDSYDCVAKGRIPKGDAAPESPPEAGPEPVPEAAPDDPALGEVPVGGPTPGFGPGAPYNPGGESGCEAGSSSRPPGLVAIALLLLLLLAAIRRVPIRATESSRCRRR